MSDQLCRHCGRPAGGRGHEPRTEGDTIHYFEPYTWAELHALETTRKFFSADDPAFDSLLPVVLMAVRTAIDKAVDIAEEGICAEDCAHAACLEARRIRDDTRALGKAP